VNTVVIQKFEMPSTSGKNPEQFDPERYRFVIGEGLVRTGIANQGRRAASVSRLEISADYTDYADF
jgi:hypothetical protein